MFAEDGVHDFTIAVKDVDGTSATITGTTTVADAPLAGVAAASATGVAESVTPATLTSATFSDGNSGAPLADFSIAAVNWGDGGTVASDLSISGSAGNYTVTGSHLYVEEGAYNFSITVKDTGGNTATITGTANVADAPLTSGTSVSATGAVESVTPATLTAATFSDADTAAPLSDFSIAAVNWGDGGTDASGLSISGSAGNFTITGSHLYAEQGSHNFSITVQDQGGNTATIIGAAEVGPMVDWSNPADITYGEPLDATQLDATAHVPGTFSYTLADGKTSANGAVLQAGAGQTLNVTFMPTDNIDYPVSTAQVEINVDPATLAVKADDASRAYGAANPPFTDTIRGFVNGDGAGVVSGAASLTTTADSTSPAGTYTITAAQGTLSAANYTFTFQSGTLTVTSTAPVLTWNNPADITYGEPLGPTQLDAMANVPGTFRYTLADGTTPANGALLQPGQNQTLKTTFTPADTTDYTTLTDTVQINVGLATLTYTATVPGNYTVKFVSGIIEVLNSGNVVVAQSPLVDTVAIVFKNQSSGPVTLTVDYSGGDPIPSGGLNFVGGGSDSLGVTGYTASKLTETFTGPHSGTVSLETGGQISYSGLTPVLINGGTASDIVFNLPAGAVGATLEDDGTPGNNTVELVSTNGAFESTTFAVPTNSLTVNAGGGTDSITTTANFSGDFNAGLSLNASAATDTVTLGALNLTKGTGALAVTAKTINLHGGITTSGAQSYNDAVTLAADATLTAGTITFAGTVDSDTTPRALTIDGAVTFDAAVGGTQPLGSLSVNGTADIEGGAVTTAATQNYSGNVTLSADTTLVASSNSSGAVVFGGTISSDSSATPRKLTINGGATFVGAIGSAAGPLDSLTVDGQSKLEESTAYIVTSTYNNPVTLTVDTTLYGSVTFNATVDSSSDSSPVSLTLNVLPGFASSEIFDAPVGELHALKSLTVNAPAHFINSPNGATQGGAVKTDLVQLYGGPVTFIGNADLTTVQHGDVDFNDTVLLGSSATANIASSGGNVNFQATVDGTSALIIETTGMTTFYADVGATTPLISIHVTGPTTFGTPTTSTSSTAQALEADLSSQPEAAVAAAQLVTDCQGAQKFDGPVLVDASTAQVNSTNGDVVFGSDVESPNASQLTVSTLNQTTATGVVHFNGPVGDNEPLSNLGVLTGGPFVLGVNVTTLNNIIITVSPSNQHSAASLQLAAGAALSSTGSNPQSLVKLLAFNNVSIDPAAQITANSAAVSIFADFSSGTFNSSGATVNLNGTINAHSISAGAGANDLLYLDDRNAVAGGDVQQILTGYGMADPVSYTALHPAVLTPLTLPPVVAGADNNAGESIGALLASNPVANNDLPPGIAVTAVDDANASDGVWQFSTDGGETWNNFGSPSEESALLLGSGDRIRFVPAESFIGGSGFIFRAWDGKTGNDGGTYATNGGATTGFSTATEIAGITVNPAPGAPSFDAGPDQTVLENAAGQTVSAWATNIHAGQIAGQSNPTLTFVVSTDHNALFAVAPAIDPSTGTLTYTPAPGSVGTAKVTVMLESNGGTAHGGLASAPQSFTITVHVPVPRSGTYIIGSGTVNIPANLGLLAVSGGTSGYTVHPGKVTGAQGGTFTFNSDGSFTYTPGANDSGYDSAQVAVTHSNGDQLMAPVTVLSQHAAVVYKFYEAVLDRAPDSAGLQYWTNYFDNGGQTGQMAVGFFESDELLDKIITSYYQNYLLRTPDAAGLAYWVGVWQATGGPEQIKAGFADSAEFYNSAGGTPDSWIDALYQRILNRPPDPAGKSFWLNYYQQQVAAGVDAGDVRDQIALGFFDSAEAYGQDVAGWFEEYLSRAPTAAEQAQYVAQMEAGATDRTIEEEITNLPEYANNPPTPPAGTASLLPDYYQTPASSALSQAAVAAKDALFSQL